MEGSLGRMAGLPELDRRFPPLGINTLISLPRRGQVPSLPFPAHNRKIFLGMGLAL